ncbi:toll/interleukin-1 receptor domain-containing protein [Nonomuraea sp. NN258]|uniref:TIR domain-containing protein n=1 Tax=Nonomuraea antri TaxID=2730852 RepID=UPI00156A5CF3|nr:TIR domain-containing protein [Nonomuraea antri]NRQ32364.1 toll/interleukin-1 receptor domain-containing protein [Nonomuraea antri]
MSSVFLDQANLSADPNLWPAIEPALSRARRLIPMASPQAAGSKWVRREDMLGDGRAEGAIKVRCHAGTADGQLVHAAVLHTGEAGRLVAVSPPGRS